MLNLAKVFIGVGHGGTDSGAVGNGFLEKVLTLSIATACSEELKRHGVEVRMSRYTDENDPVMEEVKECNEYGADLAADIHVNAGGGDGAEVFYHFNGGKGKTLAENILAEVVAIGQNSRGAKTRVNSSGRDYYAFIRETNAPAVIVECAFIDNAKDIEFISTTEAQKACGKAIAWGILKTLDLPIKEEKLYKVQCGAFADRKNADALKERLKADGYEAFVIEG